MKTLEHVETTDLVRSLLSDLTLCSLIKISSFLHFPNCVGEICRVPIQSNLLLDSILCREPCFSQLASQL